MSLTHMQKYMMFLDRLKQIEISGQNKKATTKNMFLARLKGEGTKQEADGIKEDMAELWWQMMEGEQKEMERYAASLNNKIVLSDSDRDKLLENLKNPPLPCPKLRALARTYKKMVQSGQLKRENQ
jgi:hypothetical protein